MISEPFEVEMAAPTAVEVDVPYTVTFTANQNISSVAVDLDNGSLETRKFFNDISDSREFIVRFLNPDSSRNLTFTVNNSNNEAQIFNYSPNVSTGDAVRITSVEVIDFPNINAT